MTELAFLTPDAASESICARSPFERLARAAGARWQRRDGWNVAIAFGEEPEERRRVEQTVGFADRCSLVKLELQGSPEVLAKLALRPGLAARHEHAWWCPVTPSRVLVLGEPSGPSWEELRGQVAAVDLSCGLAALSLIGPGARELLARFCAIDVRDAVTPVAGFRPGSVARTPGYVLREAADRLLVLAGWALGEYLWRVVADAAESLGGGPVGAAALDA